MVRVTVTGRASVPTALIKISSASRDSGMVWDVLSNPIVTTEEGRKEGRKKELREREK